MYIYLINILFFLFLMLTASAQGLMPTEKTVLVEFDILTWDDKPRPGQPIIFEGVKTKKRIHAKADSVGKLFVLLPKGDSYKLKYPFLGKEYAYEDKLIPVTSEPGLYKKTGLFKFMVENRTYDLDHVYFESAKAIIKQESFKQLNELADVMKENPKVIIEIGGHTDSLGGVDYNLKLSQTRADAVRNYLIKRGVSPDNIQAKGYGQSQPKEPNDTEEGRKKNRRTEAKVLQNN